MTWRKISHSANDGACIEVMDWRKSSHSNPNGACVEAGHALAGIGVRDTMNREGPVLHVSRAAWAVFIIRVKLLP